ncbi:hypothetical protein ESCO_001216 [Escovopsis weberi]|uniref:Mitotic checkpoint regulator, MAD2B-interacting-domain-containing protein n=1 Tax=Escovopsis weberi TaxID=150374 RepID=A0A0M8N4B5_ESCWE|nr:hypothetical protein ESCO_001216 [Escovopsis weberi]
MALVSYSESESESEATPSKPATNPHPPSKKPFPKVVDRSNGKIIVNLGQPSTATPSDDQPPAKRARTADSSGGGGGGGLFKGFNSFLPPPKNHLRSAPIKPATSTSTSSSAQAPRPGIHLKTSAEVGFARGDPGPPQASGDGDGDAPAPRAQPSVSEDLKPAAEVKLVGKPLMFKPLSVARGSAKKKPKAATTASSTHTPTDTAPNAAPPPSKSLFSLHVEDQDDPKPAWHDPLDLPANEQAYLSQAQPPPPLPFQTQPPSSSISTSTSTSTSTAPSLRAAADDLNLSPAARRELFGRAGRDSSILTLNMDREYQHNELLRAAGDQQLHNPVRAIQGGGKHSLRQLVHNVVNQREALEDSFAKGKSNRKEASSKYGW